MPIYEYRPLKSKRCDYCSCGFDLLQKISDHAIELCPKCNSPVKRVISAPTLGKADTSMNRDNLEKHGFTQYKKSSKGVYQKTAGKGPNVITDD